MMDNADMVSILDVFAEKIFINLVYAIYSEEISKSIINATLVTFSMYTNYTETCRMLGQTNTIKQMLSGHNHLEILQNE